MTSRFLSHPPAVAGSVARDPADPAIATRSLIALALGLGVLALWPLAVFPHPGMLDYPNHLARAFILGRLDDPLLAAHYRTVWTLVPNLGFDLWMLALDPLIGLDNAARLFIALAPVLTTVGVFALAWTIHRRITPLQLLALPLIYNSAFTKGFLGFNMSMGIALIAAACWQGLGERRAGLRLFIATLFSTLLYVVHLGGFGAYGIWVAGTRLRDLWLCRADPAARRTWLLTTIRDATQIIPVVVLLILGRLAPVEPATFDTTSRGFEIPPVRLAQIETLMDIGPVWLTAPPLVILIGFLVLALTTRRLAIAPIVAVPIAIGLVLFFTLPNTFQGIYFAAWRALFVAACFLIAGLTPTAGFGRGTLLLLTTCLTVVLAFSSIVTAGYWDETRRARAEVLEILAPIPDGSRVFFAQTDRRTRSGKRAAANLYHVAAHAVISKRVLLQFLFTNPTQQPLRFVDDAIQSAPDHSSNTLGDALRTFKRDARPFPPHLDRFDYILTQGADDPRQFDLMWGRDIEVIARIGDYWLARPGRLIDQAPANVPPR